jgi:hypothetical protein
MRRALTIWPSRFRHRWRDLAAARFDAGARWPAAQWSAFVEVVRELDDAERRGEVRDDEYSDPGDEVAVAESHGFVVGRAGRKKGGAR